MENQVPDSVKKDRLAEAYRIQEEVATQSHQRWVGEKLMAVVESVEKNGEVQGRTKYQAPEVDGVVLIEVLAKPQVGQWVEVEVTHTIEQDLVGKALGLGS